MNPRTRILTGRIRPGSRAVAFAQSEHPISLRSGHAQTIDWIAAELERQASIQIIVDWPALHAAGWSPQDREPVFHEQRPLREVLLDWLRPKGLTIRVIDDETLEITSPQAMALTHDVELYPLRDLLRTTDIAAVGQKILARLGEGAFQPQGRGAVAFDKQSESLIVSLPQADQGVVAQLLTP